MLIARSTERNALSGYYGGWNNKSNPFYDNAPNTLFLFLRTPFHRAHVIDEYLSTHDKLTFEQIRDLALNIAATDSFRDGGNPWTFASPYFSATVKAEPNDARLAALAILENWDGHFVDGGQSQWASGKTGQDAWMLMDTWIREAIRLTFRR